MSYIMSFSLEVAGSKIKENKYDNMCISKNNFLVIKNVLWGLGSIVSHSISL